MGTVLPPKQVTGQASEHQDTSTFDDTAQQEQQNVNEKNEGSACDKRTTDEHKNSRDLETKILPH